jgi:hypothetical protein
LLHLLGVHVTVNMVSDDYIGGKGTNANAGYGFQGIFQIRASLTLF